MSARLRTIVGAYLAACVAAGFAAALLSVMPWVDDLLRGRSFKAIRVGDVVNATAVIGMLAVIFALVPSSVLIAFAETRSQRSAFFYGLAGAVAAVLAFGTLYACGLIALAWNGMPLTTGLMGMAGWQMRHLLISCAAGVAGGLAYWWIAGRAAGSAL